MKERELADKISMMVVDHFMKVGNDYLASTDKMVLFLAKVQASILLAKGPPKGA